MLAEHVARKRRCALESSSRCSPGWRKRVVCRRRRRKTGRSGGDVFVVQRCAASSSTSARRVWREHAAPDGVIGGAAFTEAAEQLGQVLVADPCWERPTLQHFRGGGAHSRVRRGESQNKRRLLWESCSEAVRQRLLRAQIVELCDALHASAEAAQKLE